MDSGRTSPFLIIRSLNGESLHDLDQLAANHVQRRHGSVLTRNTILKSDHYFRGDGRDGCADTAKPKANGRPLFLMGGPNFRRSTGQNVYGVAQPAHMGLLTILALLGNNSGLKGSREDAANDCPARILWFSTREEPFIYLNGLPFVLRDQSHPFTNIPAYSGISGDRLGLVEARLKRDVLREAAKTPNRILLVHQEQPASNGSTKVLLPTLIALQTVQTPAEFFHSFMETDMLVYRRVPIPREHCHIEDFIDELVQCFRGSSSTEASAMIFSCGMGVGRTTYGMVLGCLWQKMTISNASDTKHDASSTQSILGLLETVERALQQQSQPKSVQWLLLRSSLMDDLMAAFRGNYLIITQLVRVLEGGLAFKQLVDETIDECDAIINIREEILCGRIQAAAAESDSDAFLDYGIDYLERYFSLITFCAYLHDDLYRGGMRFGAWMAEHQEIWTLLQSIRGQKEKLKLFRPISHLQPCSGEVCANSNQAPSLLETAALVKGRSGSVLSSQTILKMDHYWIDSNATDSNQTVIRGAPNFRHLPGDYPIYATAQPTLGALNMIIDEMRVRSGKGKICWINVREEPLVYIKGDPFVLRDQHATLRNIRSYKGITWMRLEQMDMRLKDDIMSEAKVHGHQILLHVESQGHQVQPRWEYIDESAGRLLPQERRFPLNSTDELTGAETQTNIKESIKSADNVIQTPREIFTDLQEDLPNLIYYRIPITAGETYQPGDIEKVMQVILNNSITNGLAYDRSTSIIFNCQCGAGRSTFGTVLALQVIDWIRGGDDHKLSSTTDDRPDGEANVSLHYRIINGLLRVIPDGQGCKMLVDRYIDQAGSITNLRRAIEECRLSATDDATAHGDAIKTWKGIAYLKRYFMLIVFQAYLHTTRPQEHVEYIGQTACAVSFSTWFTAHQEFQSLLDELERHGHVETLLYEPPPALPTTSPFSSPLQASSEAVALVQNRPGSVLAPLTILKYDHFPGCQKLCLPDRLPGAPNYRAISVIAQNADTKHQIVGVAMPTASAVQTVLDRMGSQGRRRVLWICLREEPVIFINGKPFVLRIVKDPVTNLEMTGIHSDRVEMMEERLKGDILAELSTHQGRILIHDEIFDEHSQRHVTMPSWEPAREQDIQTPNEVFSQPRSPSIDTDEQAPIPAVFDRLLWLISGQPEGTDIVFNCQMGRGRTTTGMLIAQLYLTIKLVDQRLFHFQPNPATSTNASLTSRDVHSGFLAGNYRVILQLLPLLEYGKMAKRLTDNAIDNCSHIQNLREAILEYRLLSSFGDGQPAKGDLEIYARGINYLLRYAYLILFTNYLLEEWAGPHFWQTINNPMGNRGDFSPMISSGQEEVSNESSSLRPLFADWLKERREIQNLLKKASDIGFE